MAGLEIGRFVKGSIEAASSLNEAMSFTQVVFKDSADDIVQWSKTSAESLGQSQKAALSAATDFGGLGKTAGLTGTDLTGFSKQMVTLATDMASAKDTSPEEAITALGAALRGESEPIRKYNVLLDDATLRNRALKLGLISTTKDALTPQQKVLAAQAEIMAQTSDIQGDFARTSGSLANQQRVLSAQTERLKVTIGDALLPVLVSGSHILTETLLPALQRFAEKALPAVTKSMLDFKQGAAGAIGDVKKGFADGLDLAGPFDNLGRLLRNGVEAVKAFVDGFKNGIDIPGDPFDNIGRAVRNIVEFLRTIPGEISTFLATLKTGLTENDVATPLENIALKARDLYDDLKKAIDFVKDNEATFTTAAAGALSFAAALEAIKTAQGGISTVQAGFSSLAALAPSLGPLLANPIGIAVAAVVAIGVAAFVAYKKFKPFRDIVDNVGRTIRDVAVVAFHALVDAAVAVGNFVGTAFEAVRNAVDVVMAKFEAFGALLGSLFAVVVVALTPLAQWINDNVISTINAGLELIAAVIERVFGIVSNSVAMILAVLQPVFAALKTEFEVFSIVATAVLQVLATVIADTVAFWVAAFRTFIDVVTPIWEVFFQNMLTVAQTVINIILTVIETVLGVIRGVFQVFTGLISGDWSKLWEGVRTIVSSLFGAVTGIVNAIWAGILGIFANSIAGVQNTVTNGFNAVVAFVSGIPGRIASTLGGLSGILFGAGQAIIEGLLNGIRSMASAAANAAKQVVQGAINAAKSVLGIGSPSKVFAEIGVNVGQGFVVGVQKTGGMVDGAISNLLGVGTQRFATASNLNLPPVQAAPGGGVGGGSPTINIYAPLGVDRSEVVAAVHQGLRDMETARG